MDGHTSHGQSDVHTFSVKRFGDLCIIGAGQNAAVCVGFDVELQRSVAIKMPIEDAVIDEFAEGEDRDVMRELRDAADPARKSEYTLQREARLTAKVHHPGVVSVLEVGRFAEDNCLVVVMPLLDGDPLPASAPWRSIL